MKYVASKIVQRAFDLADLSNTDFLSHEEIQAYLNDAWRTVYQWLINKGDKQFIREVILNGSSGFGEYLEYKIPIDCYQILSIKDKYSGRLIPRHSESESINSNTYDVVNDKIRLYGVQSSNLLLTYYVTPTFITFPNKDVYPEVTAGIKAAASNSVLYSNGSIYNLLTGEGLGAITIDSSRTYVLGKGHVFSYNGSNAKYENYNGTSLSTGTISNLNVLYDYDWNVLYQSGTGAVYRGMGNKCADNPNKRKARIVLRDVIIYSDTSNHLIVSDDTTEAYITDKVYSGLITPFDEKSFIYKENNEFYLLTVNEDYELEEIYLDHIKPFICTANLQYGCLVTNGTDYIIKSWYPDTEFNFPNELYISLIAADLGVRFLTKQNADSSGLNNLYMNMQTTFMNTLSQAGDYTRIKKIYRG